MANAPFVHHQKRLPGPTPHAHVALSPCVVIHTEETQLPRFADRLRGFQLPPASVAAAHNVALVAVASPLIYAQMRLQPATTNNNNSSRGQSSDAHELNAKLRAYTEAQFGGGRIRAHRVYQLDWSCADPEWIPSAAPILHLQQQHAVFRIVAFPKQLQRKMAALVQSHGLQTHPTQFSHELYVVMQPLVSPYFHFGVAASSQNNNTSSPGSPDSQLATNAPSFAADAPCRAYFKMEESLRYVTPLRPGDRVIDVGASPGGWTECLLNNGARVVAVDPGELTIIDLRDKPVVHLQMLLEDARPQLESMGRTFAMCVCDINVRVQPMAALMKSIAHLLLPGASVVFTLKLGKRPTAQVIQQSFELACEALKPSFRDFQLLWLHANTQNERTLVAVRR